MRRTRVSARKWNGNYKRLEKINQRLPPVHSHSRCSPSTNYHSFRLYAALSNQPNCWSWELARHSCRIFDYERTIKINFMTVKTRKRQQAVGRGSTLSTNMSHRARHMPKDSTAAVWGNFPLLFSVFSANFRSFLQCVGLKYRIWN